jgi:hypothetical protein
MYNRDGDVKTNFCITWKKVSERGTYIYMVMYIFRGDRKFPRMKIYIKKEVMQNESAPRAHGQPLT